VKKRTECTFGENDGRTFGDDGGARRRRRRRHRHRKRQADGRVVTYVDWISVETAVQRDGRLGVGENGRAGRAQGVLGRQSVEGFGPWSHVRGNGGRDQGRREARVPGRARGPPVQVHRPDVRQRI